MKGFVAIAAGIAGFILLCLLFYFVGVYVFGGAEQATANYRGQTDARNKTVANGDYRIAQYNHFYELCGSIQTLEDQIRTTKEAQPPHWKVNVVALENQRSAAIRQYNADASKAGTAAQFKASDLPDQIDINQENTQCAS